MHRSQIEAIIAKQIEILGIQEVKKILLAIPEITLDEQGRVTNLAREDEQMLGQIVDVFLEFSHEIVKRLLFEMDAPAISSSQVIEYGNDANSESPNTPAVVQHTEKDELVDLAPEEPFTHSGSDAIQKALESLDSRTSAEGSQDGPSNNPVPPQTQGSVQKLNDIIKQYNS